MNDGSKTFTANIQDEFTFCGDAGATRMYNLLRLLCHDVPTTLGGMHVLSLADYERGVLLDVPALRARPLPRSGRIAVELTLDAGTVLLYPVADSPVLQADFTARAPSQKEADARLERMRSAMQTWFRQRT